MPVWAMVEARRGPHAFNVSVPSDGLKGRPRPEKPTCAQVLGWRRRAGEECQVCGVGPRRRWQVDAGAQVRCGTGRARRRVAVAGVQAIGFEQGAGLSGVARRDAGGRRRTPLRRGRGRVHELLQFTHWHVPPSTAWASASYNDGPSTLEGSDTDDSAVPM